MGIMDQDIGVGEGQAKEMPQSQITDQQDSSIVGNWAVNFKTWFGLSIAQLTVSCKSEVVNSPYVKIR